MTMTQMFLEMFKTWILINSTFKLFPSFFNIEYFFSNIICTTRANTACCTLSLLLKRDCILWVFHIMLNLTLPLVKVIYLYNSDKICQFWVEKLICFFHQITILLLRTFFSSSLNLKKVSLINLTACKNFDFIFLSSLSEVHCNFIGSIQFTGNSRVA